MKTIEEIIKNSNAMRVSKKKLNTLRYVFYAILHDIENLKNSSPEFQKESPEYKKLFNRAKDICIEMGNETEKYCELKMYESA